jgi:hypothetical protein
MPDDGSTVVLWEGPYEGNPSTRPTISRFLRLSQAAVDVKGHW